MKFPYWSINVLFLIIFSFLSITQALKLYEKNRPSLFDILSSSKEENISSSFENIPENLQTNTTNKTINSLINQSIKDLKKKIHQKDRKRDNELHKLFLKVKELQRELNHLKKEEKIQTKRINSKINKDLYSHQQTLKELNKTNKLFSKSTNTTENVIHDIELKLTSKINQIEQNLQSKINTTEKLLKEQITSQQKELQLLNHKLQSLLKKHKHKTK